MPFVVTIGVLAVLYVANRRWAARGDPAAGFRRSGPVGGRVLPRSMLGSAPRGGVAILAIVLITPTLWRLFT